MLGADLGAPQEAGDVPLPSGVSASLEAYFDGEWHRLQLPEHLGGYGAPPSLKWSATAMLATLRAWLVAAVAARLVTTALSVTAVGAWFSGGVTLTLPVGGFSIVQVDVLAGQAITATAADAGGGLSPHTAGAAANPRAAAEKGRGPPGGGGPSPRPGNGAQPWGQGRHLSLSRCGSSIGRISLALGASASADCTRLRCRRRMPSGSSEAAWSVPFHVRSSVKCRSM